MKKIAKLKKEVYQQNIRLSELGLVILTEGNVSQISEDRKYMVIKPSGIPRKDMTPEKMVVVEVHSGKHKGKIRPSVDTPTHLEIYKRFPKICGIAHTHSIYATAMAQTGKPIPCYGTTHADHFYGDVPITRLLTDKEIEENYEINTGKVICEALDPDKACGVLLNRHGSFCFGNSSEKAVDNALILEKISMLAILSKSNSKIPNNLLKKHHERMHGKDCYYGQGK